MSQEVSMKAAGKGLVVIVVLVALLGAEAEAARMLRDVSGDSLQSYESRMMDSPMASFPDQISIWPRITYPSAPLITSVIVQIQPPVLNQPSTPPTRATRPKFWSARCGVFVELEVSSPMSLMEKETKPCSP